MESNEGLTQDVETLLVGDVAGVDESVGDVLREDGYIFMIRAEVSASFVLGLVNFDDGFGIGVPVMIGIDLFGLTQLGVVFDDVLLVQVSLVVLVYFVPVVLPHEGPGKAGHGLRTSSHQ